MWTGLMWTERSLRAQRGACGKSVQPVASVDHDDAGERAEL